MLGINLICLLFPLLLLFPAKVITGKETLLDKEDTEVMKGIAACLPR